MSLWQHLWYLHTSNYRSNWTTATRCCTVCLTASSGSCSHSRTLLHVWITGARRSDHITPVVHWLPVRRRVDYKVACLVHQSVSGHAPRYLADDINLVANTGHHLLRSAYDRTCAIAQYLGHTPASVTEVSASLDHVCGTLCRHLCDKTLAMDSLGNSWEHFYFGVS